MRAERAFRSPQLFRRNRPKISCTWPNNPTRPASFLRQFSPQHSPVARLFRGKKGLFCPQRPPSPPFCQPERLVLPQRRPFFCPARARMEPRLARFCPGPRRRRTPPGPRKPRVCGFFARPRPLPPAVRRPNARRLPRPPPKPPRRAPPARPLPPSAARRSAAAPPRHSLGAGNPDCRGRLSRFAVKKCATPWGDQIPGHDG